MARTEHYTLLYHIKATIPAINNPIPISLLDSINTVCHSSLCCRALRSAFSCCSFFCFLILSLRSSIRFCCSSNTSSHVPAPKRLLISIANLLISSSCCFLASLAAATLASDVSSSPSSLSLNFTNFAHLLFFNFLSLAAESILFLASE